MRILYIEDEPKMGRLVRCSLEEEGHECDVCEDGDAGYELARSGKYDLLIIDRLLPGMNGVDICRFLRGEGHSAPIIMLTARDALIDTVEGLDAGADDYIAKPFELPELLARVRAHLRRRSPAPDLIKVGELVLNFHTRDVRHAGRPIVLTDREFRLLEFLMRNAGRAISRAEITEVVWGLAFDSKTNLVDVYINFLRGKIDSDPKCPLIRTVRGVGYRIG